MKRPACVVGCCLIFFLGLLFYFKMPEPFSDSSVSGRSIPLYGTVCDKYQKKSSTYLMIENAGFSGKGSKEKHKVIIKLDEAVDDLASLPPIGSRITVEGKGMLFSRARNPGNFDLAQYEMIRGIDFEIYNAVILKESSMPGNPESRLKEKLCLLREKLSDNIDRIYGPEDAGIIKAMLLGDRADLSEETRNRFRRSGMSHILCISALHITLLGMTFLKLVRKTGLGKPAAYLISFVVTYMYGMLTGAGVSTLRALITFALMMAADLLGRTPDLLSSMSVAAVIILLMKPLYVLDPGFILSFSAVSGIGILGPPLQRLIPCKNKTAASLVTSLSVNIFMLPETLFFFFQIPLYSVIINLAVIPLAGILLISGVISMITCGLFVKIGIITGVPAKIVLVIYNIITELNEHTPFSQITPGRPEIWQILIYYALIISVVWIVERTEISVPLLRVAGLTGVLFAIAVVIIHIRPSLSLTMVDVGQGDCHFLETGSSRSVMIDCGSSDIKEVAKYRVIPYVMSRGYDRIDYAVVTHPDLDHISGFLEMLEPGGDEFDIGTIILPDMPPGNENYEKLISCAEQKGIRVLKIRTGDHFRAGRVSFRCLNPGRDAYYTDANEYSVCLSITMEGSSFAALYTGDAEGGGEDEMMRNLPPDIGKYTLLKCAHHGSSNSTPDSFLERISPSYTFISAGVDNKYGHPNKELMERLENAGTRTYVTKERGAVRMDVYYKKAKITYYISQQEGTS